MTIYELKPRYDARASFYGKAQVIGINDTQVLKSYLTYVCIIKGNHAFITDTYSNTTLRHIKEFLKQNGFNAENKKQIENFYLVDNRAFNQVINQLGL